MIVTARSMTTTMICAATLTAGFVGGKATRDALFLTSVDVTSLPTMLMATSLCSILLVAAQTRLTRRISPAVLVPASFVASGILFVAEWLARSTAPVATAVIVYLHISGSGPLLASGFWLIVSERFDPRTAKRRFGQIAGASTLGGLLGALLAERVAAISGGPAMLLCLAGFQIVTAWLVWLMTPPADPAEARTGGAGGAGWANWTAAGELAGRAVDAGSASGTGRAPRSGLRVVAQAPHLHHLAALVLLGTTSAALVEYLFKARAVEAFGPGDRLLRFFALYYAASALITFLLQTLSSRPVLERFGLGLTASTPSIALLSGSAASLVAPGFGTLLVARGAESIFRGSWFRAAYELFYTPIPPEEKRAAKSVIDVALDRLGDAVGGGLVRLAVVFVPAAQSSTILGLAMASSAGAIVAASQLNRWYVRTLEHSLVKRARGLDLSLTDDESTRNVIKGRRDSQEPARTTVDPQAHDIRALRSRQPDRAIAVLSREEGMGPALVPHVIPLMAEDSLADYALFALRKVAEEHVGEITDALLDPNQDYAVRRRLARVFSVCVSQRAADGLVLALDDERFDVRFQSARSLASILDKNPRIRLDTERICDVVLREVAVGRPVWESRRLLDGFVSGSPLDEFVRDRAGQSLAHVFTLLSLILPREPLQIAFRSLHAGDKHLRGTALEYLDGVLPAPIRQHLWPFLVYQRGRPTPQPRDEIIADLLRSSGSVTLKDVAGDWEKQRVAGFGAV